MRARGTRLALARAMAAVLCLVLLPLVLAVGFMLGVVRGEGTLDSVIGGLSFVALSAALFGTVFKMSRQWDDTGEH